MCIELKIEGGELECFSGQQEVICTSLSRVPHFHVLLYQAPLELQSLCLQTHYMPEDHMAAHIHKALSETLHQWKLEWSQLVGITTDSSSNVKLARELLK